MKAICIVLALVFAATGAQAQGKEPAKQQQSQQSKKKASSYGGILGW